MKRQAALITGSSRGIGLGAACALAKQGFAIALNAPKEDAEMKDALAAISAYHVPVISACFDVTDLTCHQQKLDEIESQIGPLTTLVNNAGVGVMQRGDPLEVTEESYDRCMAVNSKALFFLSLRHSPNSSSAENGQMIYSIALLM